MVCTPDCAPGERLIQPATAPGSQRQLSDDVMIEVDGLAKHFGQVRAVDGISCTVNRGAIFSFLGHNAAGKTTTIRMLTGRTLPTAGRATIAGMDVVQHRTQVLPIINVVPE